MKTIIILLALALSAPQFIQAQGTTTYLSNLGQASAGSLSVGSDSWRAALLVTGTNAAGYVLDSIQVAMADASGSPSGFTLMLFRNGAVGAYSPGSSLGTLNGALNPVAGGIYSYSPAATLMLTPYTGYFIVLTAGTTGANGAYDWSYAGSTSYNPSGGWSTLPFVWTSSDNLSWAPTGASLQFAVNATSLPIPEPSTLGLGTLGLLGLVLRRRGHRA